MIGRKQNVAQSTEDLYSYIKLKIREEDFWDIKSQLGILEIGEWNIFMNHKISLEYNLENNSRGICSLLKRKRENCLVLKFMGNNKISEYKGKKQKFPPKESEFSKGEV